MAFKHAVMRVNKGTCVVGKNVMFEILRQGLRKLSRSNILFSSRNFTKRLNGKSKTLFGGNRLKAEKSLHCSFDGIIAFVANYVVVKVFRFFFCFS